MVMDKHHFVIISYVRINKGPLNMLLITSLHHYSLK